MKPSKEVQSQIESLTDNEDFRQDLWVAHLSGQQQLSTVLQTIQAQHNKAEEFQYRLRKYAASELSSNISQLLENFNKVEGSILYMLILGYSVHAIGNHYGTSPVRIQQSINTMQKHSIWNKLLVSV